MRVFIDSGGFLAVMDRDDPHHPAARDISARLVSIRARTSHSLAAQFLRSLKTSGIVILRVTPAIEAEAERIFLRHADKDFSFTDCTSFALIEVKRLEAILSFDRHFRQYRFRHRVINLTDPRDVR
jgi:predicted nucleic acid-binding protein